MKFKIGSLKSAILESISAYSIYQFIKKENVDIVLVFHVYPRGKIIASIQNKLDIPIVLSIFGELQADLHDNLKNQQALYQILSTYDIVLALSKHCANGSEKVGFDAAKVQVIPYGIDIKHYVKFDINDERIIELKSKHGIESEKISLSSSNKIIDILGTKSPRHFSQD